MRTVPIWIMIADQLMAHMFGKPDGIGLNDTRQVQNTGQALVKAVDLLQAPGLALEMPELGEQLVQIVFPGKTGGRGLLYTVHGVHCIVFHKS